MKRRTLLPTGISIVLGGIILLSSIIGLIVNKNVEYYSIFLLILSSLVIISAGSLTYYLHDRLFGFVNLVGTIMGFVAVRMFYEQNFNDYSIPFILVLLCVLSLIFNFSSIILSVYRLPINQQVFDNKIFKDVLSNQKSSLILALINVVTLLIIIISLILNRTNMTISIIVCVIVLLMIIGGKVLSFKYKHRIGSLIIFASTIILIMGINPKEFSVDNTCILLILLEYVLSIVLVLCEFVKFDEAEDTKFGPKEYKK